MDLLIKNAQIIDFSKNFVGDIYIKNGIIEKIGKNLKEYCEVLDLKGYVVMPSFVDLHSHFRDPGLTYKEDIESGSRAAVRGGYTAVNLMANTKPVCSDMKVVNYVKNKVKQIGLIDVSQAVSLTKDMQGEDVSHLDLLEDGVKVISEDGKGVASSKVMFEAMKKIKEKGFVLMDHEDDKEIFATDSRLGENLATFRDVELAKTIRCNLHVCHVSTKEALSCIINAKKEGFSNITCEVTPHHIALTNEIDYRVNPPLREKGDVNFIIKAIKEGFVDAIGTDHAPHSEEDKKNGAPGMSGIETSFSICYTKLVKENNIALNKLSEIMSKNPSDILGFNKGRIDIGFEGDLVVLDLNKKYEIDSSKFESKGKNTPFNGMEVYGEILRTLKGGRTVYRKY
ncbi:dihydroorotase [Clostridium guangxiense]|uniref:dihydroorotase n=1 Tax=Clostridium guangxiense TaxID=1662055 RepID=UPI001E3CA259|nr:dihydroorotase [Clostridium guangxiense]MCD2347264.1 dihydroorotase [Clostridium guangxiense]